MTEPIKLTPINVDNVETVRAVEPSSATLCIGDTVIAELPIEFAQQLSAIAKRSRSVMRDAQFQMFPEERYERPGQVGYFRKATSEATSDLTLTIRFYTPNELEYDTREGGYGLR